MWESIALERLLEEKIGQIHYQEENDKVRKFMCNDLIEYVIFSLFQLKKELNVTNGCLEFL